MASVQEFRRVNEIINAVKNADGQNAHLFDVLDKTSTSLSWWKDHKKWVFHRFKQISLKKIEGENYLIYTKPEDGSFNE